MQTEQQNAPETPPQAESTPIKKQHGGKRPGAGRKPDLMKRIVSRIEPDSARHLGSCGREEGNQGSLRQGQLVAKTANSRGFVGSCIRPSTAERRLNGSHGSRTHRLASVPSAPFIVDPVATMTTDRLALVLTGRYTCGPPQPQPTQGSTFAGVQGQVSQAAGRDIAEGGFGFTPVCDAVEHTFQINIYRARYDT